MLSVGPPLSTACCRTLHLKASLYYLFSIAQALVGLFCFVRASMARAPKRPAQPASSAGAPGQRRRVTQTGSRQLAAGSSSPGGQRTTLTYADTVRGGSRSTPRQDPPILPAASSSAPGQGHPGENQPREDVVSRGAAASLTAPGASLPIESPAAAGCVAGGPGEPAHEIAAAAAPALTNPRISTRRHGKSPARPARSTAAVRKCPAY